MLQPNFLVSPAFIAREGGLSALATLPNPSEFTSDLKTDFLKFSGQYTGALLACIVAFLILRSLVAK